MARLNSIKHSAVLHSALERYVHGLGCTQHSALSTQQILCTRMHLALSAKVWLRIYLTST
jgi:hypothetical protein